MTIRILPILALWFMPSRQHGYDLLAAGTRNWRGRRSLRATMEQLLPRYAMALVDSVADDPLRSNGPKEPTLPTPTDVPVPEPTDVPVPEPSDVPPPDPRDVPPPQPTDPGDDPQPRPIP